MEYAWIIVKQITIMFLIICIGVLCLKTKIITADGNKHLSGFILNIVCPVLIFMAYQTEFSPVLLRGLLWAFALTIVSYVIVIGAATLMVRKKADTEWSIERFGMIYSNCAFMGIPLISGIFGAEGVLYVTAYLTFFNLLVWTHGVMIMKDEVSLQGLLKALRSPTVIAVFAGLICYVTNIRLPEIPATALSYISDMNTPLAVIVAGVTIAQTNPLKSLKNPRIYLVAAMRLVVLPIAVFFATRWLGAPKAVFMCILIATACPTAATGTLFAISYGKNAFYSSEIFAVTTILSALTLPLIAVLGGI